MNRIPYSFGHILTPLLLAVFFTGSAAAQSGQPIYLSYEGFFNNEDGTYTLMFGYYNHNSDTVTILAGPDNTFVPSASGDRGQPTVFFPGRHRSTCRMVVEADFDDVPRWTVEWAGHRDTTTALVLEPRYSLENAEFADFARERIDTRNVPRRTCINSAPRVNDGGSTVLDGNTRLSQAFSTRRTVTDDGLPRGGALTAAWRQVGGLGTATFQNPNQAGTTISFSAPGEYDLELSVTDSDRTTLIKMHLKAHDREQPRIWPTVETLLQLDSDYFEEGEAFVLVAEATAYRGASVRGVDFLVDGIVVGTATDLPYQVEWVPAGTGPHTLQATVTDSGGRAGESTAVEVYVGSPGFRGVARHIALSEDDAEELDDGSIQLDNNDLDLGLGGRLVGLRFTDLGLPRGAEITRAYIQFSTRRGRDVESTELWVRAQASGNAAPFAGTERNLSARATGNASVPWSPPAWLEMSMRSESEQTPDLSALVQEVVARADWRDGNALVFFIGGTVPQVNRSAYSYDLNPTRAPVLYLEYRE